MVNFNRILGAGLTSLDARQKLVSRLKNKGIRNKIILEIIKNIPETIKQTPTIIEVLAVVAKVSFNKYPIIPIGIEAIKSFIKMLFIFSYCKPEILISLKLLTPKKHITAINEPK